MQRLALCAAALILAACSQAPPKPAGPLPQRPGEGAAAEAVVGGAAGIDIGDAEYHISCSVTVPRTELPAGATIQELTGPRDEISMATLNVTGAPAELLVTCAINAKENFAENPVVLRGRLFREITIGQREPLGEFTAIAGKDAMALNRGEGAPSARWQFNVLTGLQAPPETMLVTAELTMLMTPSGTDEATLDAQTASVTAEFETVELSNPLRINFNPAGS